MQEERLHARNKTGLYTGKATVRQEKQLGFMQEERLHARKNNWTLDTLSAVY